MSNILSFKNFIFDLDNTLYDEKLYLFPVYKKISHFVQEKYKFKFEDVLEFILNEFHTCGRLFLFDKLINKYSLDETELSLFLDIMRTIQIKGKISLYYEMRILLKQLNTSSNKLFIVTNGNVLQQKNKIKYLNWDKIFLTEIVYANDFKPKPAADSVEYLLQKHKLKLDETIFIGDAQSDKNCATNACISFLHVNSILKLDKN